MNTAAFYNLSYGVYIITSMFNEEFSGCVVNTVTQVTSGDDPKLIVAVNKGNYTEELIEKSKKVNVAVLSEEATFPLIAKFGFRTGKDINKREICELISGKNGIPIVKEGVVSYFETSVVEQVDVGTHMLFVLKVEEAENISDVHQMTYEYYHKVIKGKTPEKASTFIKGE